MSEAVARALAGLVNAKRMFIQTGFCPKCLKGGESTAKDIPRTGAVEFWHGLLTESKIDVYQALHMFVPGKNSIPRFKESLKSPFEPGDFCRDESQCTRTCYFCHYLIEDDEHIAMRVAEHAFSVHTSCLSQCSFIPNGRTKRDRCHNQVPIVPRYAKTAGFDANYCKAHSQAAACNETCKLKKEEFFTAIMPAGGHNSPKNAGQGQHKLELPPPPAPGAPVRKPPPKQQRPTKLERESEKGRSKDIKAMFGVKPTEEFKRPSPAQAYERPVVVFTPHAHTKSQYSKKKFNFDP